MFRILLFYETRYFLGQLSFSSSCAPTMLLQHCSLCQQNSFFGIIREKNFCLMSTYNETQIHTYVLYFHLWNSQRQLTIKAKKTIFEIFTSQHTRLCAFVIDRKAKQTTFIHTFIQRPLILSHMYLFHAACVLRKQRYETETRAIKSRERKL